MTGPLTHCVVVLADLPIGVMAAQIVHAAGESAAGLPDSSTHALALYARGPDELAATLAEIERRGLACVPVREPDSPYCGALLAIGVRPVEKDRLKFLRHLPLIKLRSGSSKTAEQQAPSLQVAGSSPAPSST